MMQENKIKVACFGELLWDIFPGDKRRIGGAPFNVAYHLFKMGIDATMISAIGSDDLGLEVLNQLKAWNMSTEGLQIHESYPTSTVVAHMDENNDAHYDIVENVAWDFIEKTIANQTIVHEVDALVFGTLSTRNEVSRYTLFDFLERSNYNVFDINLREPFYQVNTIKDLLYKTDLAKFNKAELRMMLDFMGKSYSSEKDSINYLQDTFDLREVIISKGSKGALYAREDNFYLYPTVPVAIKDTVGSGDSFLAGFLSKRLEKDATAEQTMRRAVTLGAFVTAKEGACPEYSLNEFVDFHDQHAVAPLDFTDN
ncbi:carbohydrate kinase family protein [Sphingobacterium paludis]|uniref:Fructokinase n=1 Tax=Sphingobacterium paludis TaxID=1476465 RepID=A0A4R7CVC0_9SPHI|nr:carbohydrate kinase [Sphingobacterium paludis]TDS09748.1 fructokinase [Sphingobacterium paludis]